MNLFSEMVKKSRKFEQTLLVICEGSKTEPNYFGMLKNIAIDNKIWTSIEIFPIPIIDEGETYQPNNRKKRHFVNNTKEAFE